MLKEFSKYCLLITCIICSTVTVLVAATDYEGKGYFLSQEGGHDAQYDSFYFDNPYIFDTQNKQASDFLPFIESEKEEDENDKKNSQKLIVAYYGIIAEYHATNKSSFFTDNNFFNKHNQKLSISALNKCTWIQVFQI